MLKSHQKNYGTATSQIDELGFDFLKRDKTSKAMNSYLERAQEHDRFMKEQTNEFEVGKRHLANIMGEDPLLYEDQEKIDVRVKCYDFTLLET